MRFRPLDLREFLHPRLLVKPVVREAVEDISTFDDHHEISHPVDQQRRVFSHGDSQRFKSEPHVSWGQSPGLVAKRNFVRDLCLNL